MRKGSKPTKPWRKGLRVNNFPQGRIPTECDIRLRFLSTERCIPTECTEDLAENIRIPSWNFVLHPVGMRRSVENTTQTCIRIP